MWQFMARQLGYADAYDVEDGRLIVHGHGLHFYSWRDAVVCHWARR
jgi:hypothetical protein